ncbi:hypothetical protein [Enterococcus hirae]|uniref:hypothetical protein n=1 Tax=Enterococcus hirae TaxID=1354 RepID=UPI000F6ED767|nr:hypothetical protein [Enterococcus hirae]VEE81036.1 Uncharacterised protein [Enterococcus hirae]
MNEHEELEKNEELEAQSLAETTVAEEAIETDPEKSSNHSASEDDLLDENEQVTSEQLEAIESSHPHEARENQVYLETKEKDHQDIVLLIETAEAELADLRLRKYLLESDFSQLLDAFERYILKAEPISPIGKTSLIEYFTYELLKALNDIGLKFSNTTYDTWETRHFSINYRLNESNQLVFSFVLPTIDQRYQVESLNLLEVSPETMEITVQDDRVLSLIRYWSVERVFSAGQLTIFNHKFNQILAHARHLGFLVKQTLLDNTQPLHLNLQSQFELTDQVLDDIFIVAMKNPQYDFEKIGEEKYQVLLDKGQSMIISKNQKNQTMLEVSSGEYHRSVIDFFINYEFLVPLMVRKA